MNTPLTNERTIAAMKKNKITDGSRRVSKRKLELRLEHIVQLTTEQLGQIAGASTDVGSCGDVCSRSD